MAHVRSWLTVPIVFRIAVYLFGYFLDKAIEIGTWTFHQFIFIFFGIADQLDFIGISPVSGSHFLLYFRIEVNSIRYMILLHIPLELAILTSYDLFEFSFSILPLGTVK